ncbi:hypothetical protein ACLKA6_014425 [Drosophila palustris]
MACREQRPSEPSEAHALMDLNYMRLKLRAAAASTLDMGHGTSASSAASAIKIKSHYGLEQHLSRDGGVLEMETVAHSHSHISKNGESESQAESTSTSSVAGLSESAMRRQPHASTWSGHPEAVAAAATWSKLKIDFALPQQAETG